MFYGNMVDIREIILFFDCYFCSMIEFICYLYLDVVYLIFGNVFELLYLVKKYIVFFLVEICCCFLEVELREINVFKILEYVRLFFEVDFE